MKDEKKVPPLPNIRTLKTFFFLNKRRSLPNDETYIASNPTVVLVSIFAWYNEVRYSAAFFFFYTLGVSQTQQSDKDIALKFISCFILHV